MKAAWRIVCILLLLPLTTVFSPTGPGQAYGATPIHVAVSGGDFSSIQAAINAVNSSGTIWVAEGVYHENINIQNKSIDLKGGYSSNFQNYNPDQYVTVIDGGKTDRVINLLFADGTKVSGFEIRNGKTGGKGGGIFIDETAAVITENNIHNNEAGSGGGIYSNYWSVQSFIEKNDIHENTGTGIMMFLDSSVVRENTIWGNSGGGIGIYEGSPPHIPLVENNIIRDNQGHGVYGGEAVVVVRNNQITGNTGSGVYGFQHGSTTSNNYITNNGGWGISVHQGEHINNVVANNQGGGISLLWEGTIVNNTICYNSSGGGIEIETREGPFVITNCIIWGNSPTDLPEGNAIYSDIGSGNTQGEGNISIDPAFVSPNDMNYMLNYGSPCIDSGKNTGLTATDIRNITRPQDGDGDGIYTVDMGAYEMTPPPAEVISTPDRPAGPTIGAAGQAIEFSVGGAVSNLNHEIQYQFEWGDGTLSDWTSTKTATHSWHNPGQYTIGARARCATHQGAVSAVSDLLTVYIEGITVPSVQSASNSGETGEILTFSATGAGSTLGHSLQYQFDWDDGTLSDWSPLSNATHSWSNNGFFNVRVRARCAEHNKALSGWSGAVTIVITQPVIITIPNSPKGPSQGKIDVRYSFAAEGATINQGYSVEYRFDWGDGSVSDWSPLTTASHVWTNCIDYPVKAQARCAQYPDICSEWSSPIYIAITEPEVISIPNRPEGDTSGEEGTSLTFFTGGAESNLPGHGVEYRFDWGDGTFSEWSTSTQATHKWSEAGIFSVKVEARSTEDPTAVSQSAEFYLNISEQETISTPNPPEGPDSGGKDEVRSFSTGGAESNLGYSVEYRFDWGDGTFSDWSSSPSASHSWTESGTYNIRAQARSSVHIDTISEWSQAIIYRGLGEQFFKSLGVKIGISILCSLCVGFILFLLRKSIKRLFKHQAAE